MSETVRVRGERRRADAAGQRVDGDLSWQGGIEVRRKQVFDVSPGSRSRRAATDLELDDGDVVEFRTADGWVELRRAASVMDEWAPRRGDAGAPIDLVDALGGPPGTRGRQRLDTIATYTAQLPADILENLARLETLVEKGIELAARPAARRLAIPVVRWLERTVPDDDIGRANVGKPKAHGLYQLGPQLRLTADTRRTAVPEGNSLVLLHGTFSSTEGAFSPMADTEEWHTILDHYEGRVYGLEHPTLSVSPADNALALAASLPEKGQIDLVSHSRGGLVGEFLSLAASGGLDPELHVRVGDEIQSAERQVLWTLKEAFDERDLRVGSFVRVAAPAGGTILASPRIDRLAGFLLNVIPSAGGPLGWTLVVLKSLALAFLGQRVDPTVIPGIEAMMPTSPTVRLLNACGPAEDRLGVVAGDVDRSRWFKWFLEKGLDLFYGEEHDYVVDTLSMYQGAERAAAGASLHRGAEVNHFQYFTQPDSRRRTRDWLAGERDDDGRSGGFRVLQRRPPELTKALAKDRGGTPRRRVVVVPDVFGTVLTGEDGTLWPDPVTLAKRGVQALVSDDAKPVDVLDETYRALVEGLAGEFDVTRLPYDWRQPLASAVPALRRHLDDLDAVDHDDEPVHLVGHGTGGLVIRELVGTADDELRRRIGRILLLGTPNRGTLAGARLLAGHGPLVHQLALLDPLSGHDGVASALRRVAPLLESLPTDGPSPRDASPGWDRPPLSWLGLDADTVGTLIDHDWPEPRPIAVAGVGHLTPAGVSAEGNDWVFHGLDDGDGVVTADSATAGSAARYYLDASHGDLPGHAPAAYVDLLRDGRTDRLSSQRPTTADTSTSMSTGGQRTLYPTALDLEHAALTGGRSPRTVDALEVEVVHGHLRFAPHAVLVGHYDGSTFAGAEEALDDALDGALSKRDLLNIYPGELGASTLVLRADRDHPPGAVVAGMGEVGMLTSARIAGAITDAAVRLAAAELDQLHPDDPEGGPRLLGIATVLIGTAAPASMSIDQSVAAIATGVASANRRLADNGLAEAVRFDRVQIIELYEDVAVATQRSARKLVENAPGSRIAEQAITVKRHLGFAEGGKPGAPPPDYEDGTWQSIMIEEVETPLRDQEPHHGGSQRRRTAPRQEGEPDARPGERTRRRLPDHGPDGGSPPGADGAGSTLARVDTGGDDSRHQARRDLAFTWSGLAARADQTVHASQRTLVDELLADVITTSSPNPAVYHTLYQLLLPNHLKGTTSDADNILLTVDSGASRYPWEMLATRDLDGTVQPVATRSGVVRRLLSPGRPSRRRAVGRNALVIGDPDARPRYHPLPGAVEEAKQVADLLDSSGYHVTRRIRGEAEFDDVDVVNDLFADEYAILHVAAHGDLGDTPEQSGIVVGANSFVTSLELGQMDAVPPLVFLNCCHLAAMGPDASAFAASISERLIRDGVRAVVAAGWAVNDQAAQTFATTFYRDMLAGVPFGDAVKHARVIVHGQHETTNTWGAYQCYGDPGYRLHTDRPPTDEPDDYVAASEVERDLDAISASNLAPERVLDELARLKKICAELPPGWVSGSMLGAAGRAHQSCGDFSSAIEFYERALLDTGGRASIHLVGQLANLEGRHAVELARAHEDAEGTHGDVSPEIEKLLQRAATRLDGLELLGRDRTPELLRLRAAHGRREAYVRRDQPDRLRELLAQARDDYDKAQDVEGPRTSPDHTVNRIMMGTLLEAIDGDEPEDDDRDTRAAAIGSALDEARDRVVTRPEFWNRVAVPDGELLLGVLLDDLPDRVVDIIDDYDTAFAEHSTVSDRRTIRDHVDFVARILDVAGRSDLAAACDTILAGLPPDHPPAAPRT